jgi:NADP-dependent 3-hydroxy acid dehydrogenase YdfG
MIEVTQMALPHMRRSDGGRIVNLGSLAGKEGLANLAAYSAASDGVISFTKALGRDIADTNIRIAKRILVGNAFNRTDRALVWAPLCFW